MSGDIALLLRVRDWLRAGHNIVLATVVRTWGSAPRGVGSHLVFRSDGLFEGSVSGGCVEGAVMEAARAALNDGKHQLLSFGVSDANAWEVGLACGGTIDILIQPHISLELLEHVISTVEKGQSCSVAMDLQSGESSLSIDDQSGHQFIRVYQPKLRLAVVGTVHISQALVPLAQQLGYDVLLIDPRTTFTNNAQYIDVKITNDWPDDALRAWNLNARTAVVTLTHDPKLDDPALEAALASSAFYIAALGSRKSHAARCERLRARGFFGADIARIFGPAGLHIGAKTPAEIAVSVMAQMTAVLRKVNAT